MPIRPAPGGLPLVGHLPAYLTDRLEFFAGCADESGAVVRCRLSRAGYLLTDPEDVRHVLVGNHRNYVKSRRLAGSRGAYPRPRALLTSAGSEHRRRRHSMQQVFRRPLAEALAARARANAQRLASSWREGDEVEVGAEMTALAQRNILQTLFGDSTQPGLERLAAASRARKRAFERHFLSLFPLPQYLPTAANRGYVGATRRLSEAIGAEIEARRAANGRPADLLAMLMALRFDDGRRLTDAELREEALMISLTGYDSVSEALTWTLYLLAQSPAVDAAVAAEARSAPAGGTRFPYATRVVRESLRLFPPTWIFVRLARDEDRLPSGARLPAGAKVYLCPYVVQRDARHWPDPDRFDPDRFAEGAEAGRPRYAYFPFGGGPHVCIGETLALAQIVAVLATVAARHRLTLAPGQEVVPEGGLTMRPRDGLRMRVERRAA
jgi:cytochrome P450